MSHARRAYVVTAAAGGIGTELVGLLLEGGAQVLACDISSRRLAALAERFTKQRERLTTLKADTADEAGVESVRQAAQRELGEIHGLANVAGGIVGIGEDLIDRPIEKITLDEFHSVKDPAVLKRSDVMNGNDPRMLQAREYLCFAKQPPRQMTVPVRRVQNLQRDAAIELPITRGVDDAHAAASHAVNQGIARALQIRDIAGVAQAI